LNILSLIKSTTAQHRFFNRLLGGMLDEPVFGICGGQSAARRISVVGPLMKTDRVDGDLVVRPAKK
jgi:hypothetical protein